MRDNQHIDASPDGAATPDTAGGSLFPEFPLMPLAVQWAIVQLQAIPVDDRPASDAAWHWMRAILLGVPDDLVGVVIERYWGDAVAMGMAPTPDHYSATGLPVYDGRGLARGGPSAPVGLEGAAA